MTNKNIRIGALIVAIIFGVSITPAQARGVAPARSGTAGTQILALHQQPLQLRQACGTRYVVRKGDTLSIISRRCGVTVATMKRLNNLRSDLIRIGQTLVLSGSRVQPSPRATVPAPRSPNRTPPRVVPPVETQPLEPVAPLPPPEPTPTIESSVSAW